MNVLDRGIKGMRVGAVVLHYRFWPGIRVTLNALQAQTKSLDIVIVVDNHSNDGSFARISEAFPSAEMVQARENLGYAGG